MCVTYREVLRQPHDIGSPASGCGLYAPIRRGNEKHSGGHPPVEHWFKLWGLTALVGFLLVILMILSFNDQMCNGFQ